MRGVVQTHLDTPVQSFRNMWNYNGYTWFTFLTLDYQTKKLLQITKYRKKSRLITKLYNKYYGGLTLYFDALNPTVRPWIQCQRITKGKFWQNFDFFLQSRIFSNWIILKNLRRFPQSSLICIFYLKKEKKL